jgi:hypothetical protein
MQNKISVHLVTESDGRLQSLAQSDDAGLVVYVAAELVRELEGGQRRGVAAELAKADARVIKRLVPDAFNRKKK